MRPDEMALIIPILAVGGTFLVALVFVLSSAFSKVLMHWRDVSLKIRLVESGMTADEIERVVMATNRREENGRSRQAGCSSDPRKPPMHAEIKAKSVAGSPV